MSNYLNYINFKDSNLNITYYLYLIIHYFATTNLDIAI